MNNLKLIIGIALLILLVIWSSFYFIEYFLNSSSTEHQLISESQIIHNIQINTLNSHKTGVKNEQPRLVY